MNTIVNEKLILRKLKEFQGISKEGGPDFNVDEIKDPNSISRISAQLKSH